MARRKRRSKLRPKAPARVRKTKRRARTRGHQHPELIGLGLVVLGLFFGSILYLGWEGGFVGEPVRSALDALIGAGAYLLPIALLASGGLMMARSSLLDFRPFRTGLVVLGVSLAVTLGATGDGGFFGRITGGVLAKVVGEAGALLLGIAGLIAAVLLLTGASIGSLLRRSGHVVRTAGGAARRGIDRLAEPQARPEPAYAAAAPARAIPIRRQGPPID